MARSVLPVVMLQPRGKGLLGTTLKYPYEIRDEAIYFGDIGEIQIRRTYWLSPTIFLKAKRRRSTPRNSMIAMRRLS
jgi:non-homologous end joining protein Ku